MKPTLERPRRASGIRRPTNPNENGTPSAALAAIDFEAAAALDAALYWAGIDLTRTSLPVASSSRQEGGRHLQMEPYHA